MKHVCADNWRTPSEMNHAGFALFYDNWNTFHSDIRGPTFYPELWKATIVQKTVYHLDSVISSISLPIMHPAYYYSLPVH